MGILKTLAAILVMASVTIAVEAVAQTQAPPAGQRPPPSGTRLITAPGATLTPGVLTEGMKVIASYREHNGNNVLTELALKEPSASPPTEPRAPGRVTGWSYETALKRLHDSTREDTHGRA